MHPPLHPNAAAALGTPGWLRCSSLKYSRYCHPPRKRRAAGTPVLGRRALPAGRLARLGATPDFHHELLGGSLHLTMRYSRQHSLLRRYRDDRTSFKMTMTTVPRWAHFSFVPVAVVLSVS